jgi:hypothetical protein
LSYGDLGGKVIPAIAEEDAATFSCDEVARAL